MTLALLSIGTAQPDTVLDQAQMMAITRSVGQPSLEQETWLPAMYSGTGIQRRSVSYPQLVIRDILEGTRHTNSPFLPSDHPGHRGPSTGQRMEHYARWAPPLALKAARRALADSPLAPESFTHLVTVSCTGFLAPGIDIALITGLGLRATVLRTHVGYMGCHGAVNGLRVARAFTGSEPEARVLLVAVELCGLHFYYGWDPGKLIANALFADGAAAVVGVPLACAPAKSWRVAATGSCLVPDSTDAMGWTIGDHGFEMTLARGVPGLIARHLRPWLNGWLGENGLHLDRVRSWVVHPGGPKILTAVEDALNLGRDELAISRAVFAECGNMSSPTVLFILERLTRQDEQGPCVVLAFGPGLMAEALLLTRG